MLVPYKPRSLLTWHDPRLQMTRSAVRQTDSEKKDNKYGSTPGHGQSHLDGYRYTERINGKPGDRAADCNYKQKVGQRSFTAQAERIQ